MGEAPTKKRGRSPSYPGLTLETALERAERLYQAQNKHPAKVGTIMGHWDYSPGSGAGLVALAALKKFGLLTDEGTGANRKARLTDLALRIVQDRRPESEQRHEAIKEAALRPAINREVWNRYEGRLPTDDDLHFYLTNERGFTDGGATDFINRFRRTISFAGLTPSDNVQDTDGDSEDGVDDGDAPGNRGSNRARRRVTPPTDGQTIVVPLKQGQWATVEAAFPLSESAWEQMLRVLEAMKPGLVTEDDEPFQDRLPE